MARKKMTGREFIKMMRPILGIQDVRNIRELRIVASMNDSTILEIDTVPEVDFDGFTVEPIDEGAGDTETRRYIVTVEPQPSE